MTNEERNKLSLEYSELATTLLEMKIKNPSIVDTEEYKKLEGKSG